jgi:nitrous oxidase accessory protein NosD
MLHIWFVCDGARGCAWRSVVEYETFCYAASYDATISQSDFSGGVCTISNSGVYGLAENVTGKIIINQNMVVLDLNDKTITNAADDCVVINNKSKIVVRNGSVTATNNRGIYVMPGSSQVVLEKVTSRSCSEGIVVENASDIRVNYCDSITSAQEGMLFKNTDNIWVNSCDIMTSLTGIILNDSSRVIVTKRLLQIVDMQDFNSHQVVKISF